MTANKQPSNKASKKQEEKCTPIHGSWPDPQSREEISHAEAEVDAGKHSKNPEDNHLSVATALYLYCRSFYLADKPVAKEHQEAFAYWQRQARNHWLLV